MKLYRLIRLSPKQPARDMYDSCLANSLPSFSSCAQTYAQISSDSAYELTKWYIWKYSEEISLLIKHVQALIITPSPYGYTPNSREIHSSPSALFFPFPSRGKLALSTHPSPLITPSPLRATPLLMDRGDIS